MHIISDIVFIIIVIILLLVDLFVVGKKSHEIATKEAGIWTCVFVASAMLFAGYLYAIESPKIAQEFLSAFAIEKVLSVDNLFVFILVFGFFKVPKAYHHKVLFWGIIGAMILRGIFISTGVTIIDKTYRNIYGYHINLVLTIFGGFLLFKGIEQAIKLVKGDDDEEKDYSKSVGAKLIKFLFRGRVSEDYDGDKFFTWKESNIPQGDPDHPFKWIKYATPLLVVVAVIEFTDLLFAVDSIPAIFSVSKDPMVLYTSNIFAILGLRSMYFLLSNLLPLFKFLSHGLALILSFIGFKMIAEPWIAIDGMLSLVVVVSILTFCIIISLLNRELNAKEETD